VTFLVVVTLNPEPPSVKRQGHHPHGAKDFLAERAVVTTSSNPRAPAGRSAPMVTSDENVYPAEVESVMTGHPAVVPHPGPQVSPQTKGVPKSDRCRC
jgi:hypothetical protein